MSNTLLHTPADVVRHLIVNLGLGTLPSLDSDWPVGVSQEPALPDNCLTVFDAGESGAQDERTMDGGMAERYPFQVRARGVDDRTAWRKLDSIRTALAAVYQQGVSISPSTYSVQAVVKIGTILSLGKDVQTSKRSVFVMNAQVVVRQLS